MRAKADSSPVTDADCNCEKLLREHIAQHYPQHAVVGEEFGGDAEGEWVWVLDPIDGTRSFISGSPLYCTLIALLHKGKPRIGIIDLPALDERWSGCIADDLCGAWLQTKGEKKHCAVSDCTELQNAVLATTTLNVEAGKDNDALLKLYKSVGQVRLGGDASAFGCMASGCCRRLCDGTARLFAARADCYRRRWNHYRLGFCAAESF